MGPDNPDLYSGRLARFDPSLLIDTNVSQSRPHGTYLLLVEDKFNVGKIRCTVKQHWEEHLTCRVNHKVSVLMKEGKWPGITKHVLLDFMQVPAEYRTCHEDPLPKRGREKVSRETIKRKTPGEPRRRSKFNTPSMGWKGYHDSVSVKLLFPIGTAMKADNIGFNLGVHLIAQFYRVRGAFGDVTPEDLREREDVPPILL